MSDCLDKAADERTMNDESDSYEDENDFLVDGDFRTMKQSGEGNNSHAQQSIKHFQPTNKILSK